MESSLELNLMRMGRSLRRPGAHAGSWSFAGASRTQPHTHQVKAYIVNLTVVSPGCRCLPRSRSFCEAGQELVSRRIVAALLNAAAGFQAAGDALQRSTHKVSMIHGRSQFRRLSTDGGRRF